MSDGPKQNNMLQDEHPHDRNMLLSWIFLQEGVQINADIKKFVVNRTENKVFNQIRLTKR